MTTLWVGLGGAIGSIARYHVGELSRQRFGAGWPWGTLAVNLLGSLLLMALMHVALRSDSVPAAARVALGSGVLGGFTTYSSFNFETIALVQSGAWGRAAAYVAATVLGCLAAGALGWLAARAVVGA